MSSTTVLDRDTAANPFDTAINVAGSIVNTGTFPESALASVTLTAESNLRHFTPAEALALAAALQAVAVHLLEEQSSEVAAA